MATRKNADSAKSSSKRKVDGDKKDTLKSKIETESKGMIDGASKIVFKAVNILEEEIARGIVAAREVEEKISDKPGSRDYSLNDKNSKNEELMNRFRKDVHDIVDLFIDFTSIAVNKVGKMSSGIINIKQEDDHVRESGAMQQSQIPLIQVPQDMHPGDSIEIPIKLENDDKNNPKSIYFVATPLTNNNGDALDKNSMSFTPNPLIIEAGASGVVNIGISIPTKSKTGNYTSFVQANNLDNLKATVLVTVV